jgi:hypothetical protein
MLAAAGVVVGQDRQHFIATQRAVIARLAQEGLI